MAKVEGDDFDCSGTINTFKAAVQRGASLAAAPEIEFNERYAFYRRVAERAYCIVQTGDTTKYGSIIIKKGVCSWD